MEIDQQLHEKFYNEYLSQMQVHNWCSSFRNNRDKVGNELHERRPGTSLTLLDNTRSREKLILELVEEQRVNIRDIAD